MEQHTSIQDLPTELLLTIFRLSFGITSLQADRCRLSLVCRHWRDIVQESACLWTDISAHDSLTYIQKSIAKSGDHPIDIIHFVPSRHERPKTHLFTFTSEVLLQLSRWRSISLLVHTYSPTSYVSVFAGLQSMPTPRLEAITLKGSASQRRDYNTRSNVPQLPATTAFPKLRQLAIDGIQCEILQPGLLFCNVLSLNLVDVTNVACEQLLEVLRSSPSLERLELGRSPVTFPSPTTLTSIHLPRLMALHLIFMPLPVSNLLLSIIRAPNCAELFISSHFPKAPDDVVRGCLFTTPTNHFSPVLKTLLTRGLHKDIDVTRSDSQSLGFRLQIHNEDDYNDSLDGGVLRLQFRLHSLRQVEETVSWLVDCVGEDVPKIPIRLILDEMESVHLVAMFDSHMTITHLGFRAPSVSNAIKPNPILTHMAHPTPARWPLSELQVFVYGLADEGESHDEAMLAMLRCRSGVGEEGPDGERKLPTRLRRIRIGYDGHRDQILLGEVRQILAHSETSILSDDSDDESFW